MSGVAYIDTSALLKLIVREPQTSALEADLAGREGIVSSRLAWLECCRAVRRAGHRRVLQTTEQVFEAVYLIEITPAVLEAAAQLGPHVLRSLDAIHLATALSLEDPALELLTYDTRLAAAAQASGITVVQPGASSARPDVPRRPPVAPAHR